MSFIRPVKSALRPGQRGPWLLIQRGRGLSGKAKSGEDKSGKKGDKPIEPEEGPKSKLKPKSVREKDEMLRRAFSDREGGDGVSDEGGPGSDGMGPHARKNQFRLI